MNAHQRGDGKRTRRLAVMLMAALFALALSLIFASAQPVAPGVVTRGPSERGPSASATPVEAQAGNVTSLTIVANSITKRWQGFYGNVTGNISLSDSAGNLLYNWQEANPRGEIYAVNDSAVPAWSNIFCFNFTNNKSAGQNRVQHFNGTDLEGTLGMTPTAADGVDETFNRSFSGSFEVGSVSIDANSGCSMVSMNSSYNGGSQSFQEVLLTDNSSIIYTTIIEESQIGFQGAPVDFQLIVGDNGDVTSATPYYFYVELT